MEVSPSKALYGPYAVPYVMEEPNELDRDTKFFSVGSGIRVGMGLGMGSLVWDGLDDGEGTGEGKDVGVA